MALCSGVVRWAVMLAPSLEQGGGNVVVRLLVRDAGAKSGCEVVVLGGRALACFDGFVAELAEVLLGHVCEVEVGHDGSE